MYSYEEKMRAVELYLKYGLSAAAVINELEQHIKKNKLPAKDQRVVLSHNNYIMVVVRLSATIRHFRLQSKLYSWTTGSLSRSSRQRLVSIKCVNYLTTCKTPCRDIAARGRRAIFGCSFDLQVLVSVVVAGCAAGVGREREEPHEEPYSEGRESHPSTSFA